MTEGSSLSPRVLLEVEVLMVRQMVRYWLVLNPLARSVLPLYQNTALNFPFYALARLEEAGRPEVSQYPNYRKYRET